MQAKHEMKPLAMITESAVSWYFFIVAWGVLYVALSYAAKVGHAERRAAAYRSEAQAAQLRALRYQINPHFLFNTLNSLSTLVLRQRTQEAERMIMNLATFFRTSLTNDPSADVPLSDEIRMQRLYLDIEQIRFPERLSVVVDVPEELENAHVPGLILQPVVENAIKHGVARSSAHARATVPSISPWRMMPMVQSIPSAPTGSASAMCASALQPASTVRQAATMDRATAADSASI